MVARFRRLLRSDPLLGVLGTLLLATRILVWSTYPLVVEGDGVLYYEGLCSGRSSLICATGYCFLAQPIRWSARLLGIEPAHVLCYANQLVVIAALLVAYCGVRRLVSRWAAFAACLLTGIDAQLLIAAATTRPEFAQVALLLLLVGVIGLALGNDTVRTKRRLYTTAGAIFVAGYLTKYNLLPCIVLLIAPLVDGGLGSLRSRLGVVMRSAAAGIALLAAFLLTFHYPSTGTFHLNLEHGWIYIDHVLRRAEIPLLPGNGMATRKYLVLAHALPEVKPGGADWRSVDAVPPEERAPYRRSWSGLLETDDENRVAEAFAPLSKSIRAAGDYHDRRLFCAMYHYLGLFETERLLADVLLEGIRSRPGRYAAGVWREFCEAADPRRAYWPFLPVPGVGGAPAVFDRSPAGLFGARARYLQVGDWSDHRESYAILGPDIWAAGAAWLARLAFFRLLPAPLIWVATFAGLMSVVAALVRRRGLSRAARLYLLLLAALSGVMVQSAVLMTYRSKELVLCLPMIWLVAALSLSLCVAALPWRTARPGAAHLGR